jgi:hypothetical protein
MNTLAKRSVVAAIAALVPVSAAHAAVEAFSNGGSNDFVTTYAGAKDTTLEVVTNNTGDDNNFGGASNLRTQNSSGNRFRFILGFDLTSVNSAYSPYVTGVTLTLTKNAAASGTDTTTYPLIVSQLIALNAGWVQGTGNGTAVPGAATGNNKAAAGPGGVPAAVSWKQVNGSGNGTMSGGPSSTGPFFSLFTQSSNIYTGTDPAGTQYAISNAALTTAIKGWVGTASTNAGLFISNNGTSTTSVLFDSSEFSNQALRPTLTLTFSSGTKTTNWINDVSDNWSVTNEWDNGSPNGAGTTANFGNVITVPQTVTVDAPKTVSAITFDSPVGYTVAGTSAINLLEVNSLQAAININSGAQTISAPLAVITNTTITVAGGASLTLGGAVTATGRTINKTGDGRLNLGNAAALTALAGNVGGTFNVNGGIVAINAHTGADSAAAVTALNLNNGATLDVTNNDLIYAYTGTNSPAAAVRSMLVSGYNSGTWDGSGVATSLGSAVKGLGYAEAADVGITEFDGVNVTSAVLVKYTYYGDSSLDGKVDLGNDFNLFLQGFLSGGSTWELGDYNYDDTVDMNDFALFVDGISAQGVPLGDLQGLIAGSGVLSAGQRVEMLSLVPEPTSLSVCAALAGVAVLRRRRNRE